MANGKDYRLLAVGRIAADTRDMMGDTLGSFSGLALEPGSWRKADGGYSGVFLALPDRGFNVPEEGKFSDYPTRLQRIAFRLQGSEMSLTLAGTQYVRDAEGALLTGIDPADHVVERFGARAGSPKKGPGAGRLSIDSEGLALGDDGRVFISDEFACNILCCASDFSISGIIPPPAAFVPHVAGRVNFSSADGIEVERGRMPNDGLEGLSLSPDGRLLYALLQSPLAQDRTGPDGTQRFTRLLVFDVSGTRLPKAPVGHYVVELPVYGKKERAAEVNEIVVLEDERLLVLARDNRGFGAKTRQAAKPIAFKQVMSGSLAGASNLSGSAFERKAKSVVLDGALRPEIVPVRLSAFLDIADEEELSRCGLTLKKGKGQLSTKWESLVLSPALDAKRPRERLLFVGNDNDFRTRNGFMPDGRYDGLFEHDSLIMAYRVTLPG